MKNPQFLVSTLTLIVLSAYTFFAYEQVQETQKANVIAKKSMTEVNKPYVMLTNIVPAYIIDPNTGRHLHMSAVLTNLGNTPASYVRTYYCDPIIRDDTIVPMFSCKLSVGVPAPETVLGPKQQLTVFGPVISDGDYDDTKTEKKVIYIFGYTTYQDSVDIDQYGSPEQRKTRFCQRVIQPIPNPGAPPTPPGTIQAMTVNCPTFNCVDKACVGEP